MATQVFLAFRLEAWTALQTQEFTSEISANQAINHLDDLILFDIPFVWPKYKSNFGKLNSVECQRFQGIKAEAPTGTKQLAQPVVSSFAFSEIVFYHFDQKVKYTRNLIPNAKTVQWVAASAMMLWTQVPGHWQVLPRVKRCMRGRQSSYHGCILLLKTIIMNQSIKTMAICDTQNRSNCHCCTFK